MNKTYIRNFLFLVYLLFALVRFLSIYRSDIGFDLYDSPSYFKPTWSNPTRMPFIAYLFTFLANYSAIVLFQTILGIFSWILLSFAFFTIINNHFLKLLSVILILSLGITAPIVGFDSMILSESLTFSIFNLIMALMILYYKSKSKIQLIILLSFIIFYAGTKQTSAHVSIVLIFLILIFVLSKSNSIPTIRFQISLLVVSIFISSFFIWLARQNAEISGNVEITNIIERTYDDYESQKWYLERGFPGIAYQQYSSKPFEPPIGPTRSLPQVKAWEIFEKSSPIEQFAINHPLFLIFGPLIPNSYISTFTDNESALVSLARGYRLDKNYSVTNLKTEEVKPFFLANLNLPLLFWWSDNKQFQKFTMVLFTIIILFYYATPYMKRFSINQTSDNLMSHFLFVFFAGVWSNWHISVTYELDRYLMPWAVELRIIFVFALVLTLDTYLKKRMINEN
jgi:hypothetical protein